MGVYQKSSQELAKWAKLELIWTIGEVLEGNQFSQNFTVQFLLIFGRTFKKKGVVKKLLNKNFDDPFGISVHTGYCQGKSFATKKS